MKRTQQGPLTLHRETLASLTPTALRQAQGGLHVTAQPHEDTTSQTCGSYKCISVNYLCSASQ
jgi:hypothetical protein